MKECIILAQAWNEIFYAISFKIFIIQRHTKYDNVISHIICISRYFGYILNNFNVACISYQRL